MIALDTRTQEIFQVTISTATTNLAITPHMTRTTLKIHHMGALDMMEENMIIIMTRDRMSMVIIMMCTTTSLHGYQAPT